ncbi:MAG: GNAT family N-acetyltransferase [Lachnospiraceae bacterium]|nr:GNAT family N-acetyltransferase [Lachnospiraceae bacterium]
MNTPTLKTERLLLRKFTENDLQALYKIFSDKEVNKFLPWFPLNTLEEARAFYKKQFESKYDQEHSYNYAVCFKEDDYPIGYVNVGTYDSYDFGYGLCKEFWHKGIVTEAGRAVIEQLKKDGIPYITATHDVNNPRSGSVMKRLGMCYQYSYEEQWQPKDFLVTFRMYQLNLDGNDSRIYKEYWNHSMVHFVETECL